MTRQSAVEAPMFFADEIKALLLRQLQKLPAFEKQVITPFATGALPRVFGRR